MRSNIFHACGCAYNQHKMIKI